MQIRSHTQLTRMRAFNAHNFTLSWQPAHKYGPTLSKPNRQQYKGVVAKLEIQWVFETELTCHAIVNLISRQ